MTCATCNWAPTGENERLREMERLLTLSARYRDQTPGRGHITGLLHALRTAGRLQQFGYSEEWQFVGLVHDLARPLNDVHHGEIMAEIVRDRVSASAYEVLRTHGQFQAAIVHRTPLPELGTYAAHKMAGMLAEAEVTSFAPGYRGSRMTLKQARSLLKKVLD